APLDLAAAAARLAGRAAVPGHVVRVQEGELAVAAPDPAQPDGAGGAGAGRGVAPPGPAVPGRGGGGGGRGCLPARPGGGGRGGGRGGGGWRGGGRGGSWGRGCEGLPSPLPRSGGEGSKTGNLSFPSGCARMAASPASHPECLMLLGYVSDEYYAALANV